MSGAGVYGKHPEQADFLRAGAGEFAKAGLDRWFEEATETLRREKLVLPDGPTAFLLTGAETDQPFAGVFVPSQDAVGRTFPLIISAPLPAKAGTKLSALHGLCAGFVTDAAALARQAAGLSASELAARAQSLPVPDASAGAAAALEHEPIEALFAALGGTSGAVGYAVRTCLSACEQASKPGSTGAAITVDAPAPTDATLRFWLELLTAKLGATRPSLLWTAGPEGRLLAALGPPPASFLSYLANPQHRASRFWPLRTDVAAAIESTTKTLTPDQQRAVSDDQSSLASLLTAFA